ncbi:aldehyde dehydrogenase family protein [Streptomyces sp. GbtcB7]|uniref:aldehyde dehydrogenase family protein n=1 Tax=Streptomyces sp. GbtcB7 TaxID=2824752 RepID=UPI001C2F6CD8|nr:aldehyde dehydrogenase family protein [Streptomyces sp. GbtcB7]
MHLIDGDWTGSDVMSTSYNPATGEALGQYADGGAAEAQAAVAAARRAFDTTSWPRDRALRARALLELADRFEARAGELAQMLTKENGKTAFEAGAEAGSLSATLRHNAAQAVTDVGAAAEAAPGVYFNTLLEPIGVAGIIVPWNSPLALLIRSLAPALAAGCTVAVKLPGQTALTNKLIAEIVAETPSLPKGVVNIFTESGNTGAPFLVESPDVDLISYTGSTKVGRQIAATGAATLKRMGLELGGKSPMVVFDVADLDSTVPLLVAAITMFTGQFCMAGSRVLVQRGVADEIRERLRQMLSQVAVGPGDDPSTQMGPLIDKAAVERVDAFVEEASAYAKVIVRGGPVTEGPLAAGAFFRPAMLETDDLDVPLVQQEVFAPVLCFEVFDDEADALRRANATEFGLAAAVFTRDTDRARRVGREIKAGTVWTNCWMVLNDAFEEGGFKQSGMGRLRGTRGIAEFQEVKTYVQVAPAQAG